MPRFFLVPAAKGKRVVFWCVCLFVASQPALWAYLDWRHPELRDPLYVLRLRSLQSRQAESPGSPLVLLLGSSRTKYGLSPALLPLRPGGSAPPPTIYNFGINGSGSIRELMYFRRLLAEGVRPAWLLLETWPPLWSESGFVDEAKILVGQDEIHLRDGPLLYRYFSRNRDVCAKVFRHTLVPIKAYRSRLLFAAGQSLLLPRAQLKQLTDDRADWEPPDTTGWFPLNWGPTREEEKRSVVQRGIRQVEPLLNPLCIDPRSDSALHEILDECRARTIRVALFMMPEHSATRRCYTAQARNLVTDYLGRIAREYQLPVLDTRDWLPDEAFADCYHTWQQGAAAYSERFGREVLQPLLAGEPLPRGVLLAEDGGATP
jgi:hypothetical protein